VLQRVAACCSVLQCVAVAFARMVQADQPCLEMPRKLFGMPVYQMCCSVLQRVAACCSVLQCVAVAFARMVQAYQPCLKMPRRIFGMPMYQMCCSVLQCSAMCCSIHAKQMIWNACADRREGASADLVRTYDSNDVFWSAVSCFVF